MVSRALTGLGQAKGKDTRSTVNIINMVKAQLLVRMDSMEDRLDMANSNQANVR